MRTPQGVTVVFERRAVARDGVEVFMPPRMFDVLSAVVGSAHGRSAEQAFLIVYGADPNGGPESGANVIRQHVCHINRRLKKIGVRLHCTKRGGGGVYELRLVEPEKMVYVCVESRGDVHEFDGAYCLPDSAATWRDKEPRAGWTRSVVPVKLRGDF